MSVARRRPPPPLDDEGSRACGRSRSPPVRGGGEGERRGRCGEWGDGGWRRRATESDSSYDGVRRRAGSGQWTRGRGQSVIGQHPIHFSMLLPPASALTPPCARVDGWMGGGGMMRSYCTSATDGYREQRLRACPETLISITFNESMEQIRRMFPVCPRLSYICTE